MGYEHNKDTCIDAYTHTYTHTYMPGILILGMNTYIHTCTQVYMHRDVVEGPTSCFCFLPVTNLDDFCGQINANQMKGTPTPGRVCAHLLVTGHSQGCVKVSMRMSGLMCACMCVRMRVCLCVRSFTCHWTFSGMHKG